MVCRKQIVKCVGHVFDISYSDAILADGFSELLTWSAVADVHVKVLSKEAKVDTSSWLDISFVERRLRI